ncbi:hypothetical protein BO83DRAFT_414806 [Aspergillus eucalypticola CBS 122712]|uniref:C2H2-type domain-containing protein n=1 Tax=Aspergillus eucalypticola (strain CBS 122712 / IBT 29274) TaxID=1448314 RepID=A0A317W6X4_ASPEC|nr:uncharacterized protein BO83DRAFT_414806 [Aspergillus eucalypticola CBS 122712]PWY79870.1 hypothetical protein BO83DRAFT_414806 [Aspergillus eucalypticola CBS 122712]
MEWSTSSFPGPQEDTTSTTAGTHPDRLPIGQFLFPQSSAAPVPQPADYSMFANHPYGAFTSIAGPPCSIEPHVWTVNPTGGLSSERNIPPQGGVAQTAQAPFAYDEIPAESLDLLYASTRITSGQPLPLPGDWKDTNADTNPAWHAPNSAMSHQLHPAPGSRIPRAPSRARSPPTFECKWEGCSSSTRFSTEGDLVRHLKSIHISPDAYSCLVCGQSFGRKDHLRYHRRRRHCCLV